MTTGYYVEVFKNIDLSVQGRQTRRNSLNRTYKNLETKR